MLTLYDTDKETKRMHVNPQMGVEKEVKKVISRSKREANEAFGRKMNDDSIGNKKLFRK